MTEMRSPDHLSCMVGEAHSCVWGNINVSPPGEVQNPCDPHNEFDSCPSSRHIHLIRFDRSVLLQFVMHLSTVFSFLAAITVAAARSPQHVGKKLPKPASLPFPRSLPPNSVLNSKRAPSNISAAASSTENLSFKLFLTLIARRIPCRWDENP